MARGCSRIVLSVTALLFTTLGYAQLDPVQRDLVEFGYERPLQGHVPPNPYGYYYLNRPHFGSDDLVLQAAITPVYVDGEVGFRNLLGRDTDFAIHFDGGGYAFGYNEFSATGKWVRDESFMGHGVGLGVGAYHLFNPGAQIPLNGVFQTGVHQLFYERYSDASSAFVLPPDQTVGNVRAGLRFGGVEPLLRPERAAELSAWYQGLFRVRPNTYGFDGDRRVESEVHQFWGRALLVYTFPESGQRVTANIDAGTSIHPDRLSAYRLGGPFTVNSEFPLAIPGYDVGELVARGYVLGGATYSIPVDAARHWEIGGGATSARISFVPGVPQAHKTNTGLSVEVQYTPDQVGSWRVGLMYGRALDSERDGHRGANSLSLVVELDLEKMGYVKNGAR